MIEIGGEYKIEIIDLSSNGEGIGRKEGMVVFVPESMPGDTVLAKITDVKKNFARGKVINIETSSPNRIDPLCPYSGECGGCDYQYIGYDAQLAFKEKWVFESLTRIGGIENPKVTDIISMDKPWRYRNKVQYSVGRVKGSTKKQRGCDIGFYKKGSREIINCDTCLLQTEPAERIAKAIREYVKETKLPIYDEKTGTGVLRGLMVKTAFGTGEIMVVLVAADRKVPDLSLLIDKIMEEIQCPYTLGSIVLNYNKGKGRTLGNENILLAGKPTIKDRLMGMYFEISPLSFYQVNPAQTEKLYSKVRKYASLTGSETVLDLYCGVGTIGLLLAQNANKVIGIESLKPAILDANRNATINGIVNAEFICGKAEEELPKLLEQGTCLDLVILDPPRAGCHPGLLNAVAAAKPEKIIYVSCDPATLSRDIKILTQQGYNFMEAQPVDMFPWTRHVETVVSLSHKKADTHININIEFGDDRGQIPIDEIARKAEEYRPSERVTYKMIQEYIESKYNFKVHTAYIAEVKRDLGLPMYDAPNAVEELKQERKHPTPEKVEAIKDALRHFGVIK